MKRLTRIVLLSVCGLAVSLPGRSQSNQVTPVPTPGFQTMVPVTNTWDPALDEQRALPESQRNLNPNGVVFPSAPTSAATPNFGGFRIAPSTPAHSPGDTTRDLSSVGGDFNNDGCQDVVTFQVQTLSVMQGDCHGNFTRVNSQSTVFDMYHPVAVDLNHDGYPDIVGITLPFGYSGTVVALINQKNGTFSAPVVISKKASVYSGFQTMSVYDVNGDGNADVVLAGFGTQDSMTNSNVVFEVITGKGDGTFNPQIETVGNFQGKPTFGYDGSSAVRLVNGQLYFYAIVQTAVREYAQTFAGESLCRWAIATNGSVSVNTPQITPLPFFSTSPNKYLNFADINSDGTPDIAIMDGNGELYTALGASNGSFSDFQAALPYTAGNVAAVISFQDVDGDGKVDAIIAGASYVGLWPGNGDGTFRTPKVTYLAGYGANANTGLTFPVSNHVIADFDGDGVPDIAYIDTPKRALSFYKGSVDGTFHGAPMFVNTTGDFTTETLVVLATPDLNGDGIKDVIVNTPYGLLGGIADGKGNFTYKRLSSVQAISSLSSYTADFNQDGKDDVVFTAVDGSGYPHLYLGLSNGDGSVTAVAQTMPYTATASPSIQVGDINGDGIPDVVLSVNIFSPTPAKYGSYPMFNDGKGHLTAGTFVGTPTSLYGAALQDLNGDGKADLILSYGAYTATTTAVFLSSGTGFAASPTSIVQNTLPAGNILAKDVTGDGIPDLVLSITNGTSEGVSLYVGKEDGTFATGVPLVTGVVPSFVGSADLNGDGYPDIFFTNAETVLTDANDAYFGLVVLPGAGNNTFGTPHHYNIYGASTPVFPMDLYGNGTFSLLATAGNTGTTMLINTGGTSLTLSASKSTWSSTDSSTINVRVAPAFTDQALPSGYVDLYVDGASNARTTLSSNGTASFTLSGLAAGSHVLAAQYEGDANYNVNLHSKQITVNVVKATPSFVLSSSSVAMSIAQSGTATVSLTLQANAAFSGPVVLSCKGAPLGTACSFSQSNLFLAPGQTVSTTLTVAASINHAMNLTPAVGGGALTCALLFCVPLRRKKRLFAGALAGLLCLAAASQLVGCADSSPVINPGAYTVTVVGTPGDPTATPQTLSVVVTVSK